MFRLGEAPVPGYIHRMHHNIRRVLACLLSLSSVLVAGEPARWRVLIANDNCPDVTWGFTEEQTRQAFADLVRSHLDEMNRTDALAPENRDHYNLATTQEARDFVARYPARKDEFIRRAREGRVCVSPFLCNSLWGFQSAEGALRTLYPARRLERDWGIPIDVAEHIELPSLPWGMAPLLAGSGVRWVSNPFYNYDATFQGLKIPPLFRWLGPDGSEVRVLMDAWSCLKDSYFQGANLLKDPKRLEGGWLAHYEGLGAAYPLKIAFASGTHSDISPESWKQTRGFADAIIAYNRAGTNAARLENSTLAKFCLEVDAAEKQTAFLPAVRGCFGHSWELWPVSLAPYVAAMRNHEQSFLAAESLVTLAGRSEAGIFEATRPDREQAEWYWAMLSDHAWNGTDLKNKRYNADLRKAWGEGLGQLSRQLTQRAWQGLGLQSEARVVTVFNPLSFASDRLVSCAVDADTPDGVSADGKSVPSQLQEENGRRTLVFVATRVPAYGFKEYRFEPPTSLPAAANPPRATAQELDGPFYRLTVNPTNGGIQSLVHKATGRELVDRASGKALGQTVFFQSQERLMEQVHGEVLAKGPVFSRLEITGRIADLRITNQVTLYRDLDRIDLDYRIFKPAVTNEQRLCQVFPIRCSRRDLHVETTGAVLTPAFPPDGDLLPGADPRRLAVQGFVDAAPAGQPGITLVPLDAFMLRLDDDTVAFEVLGNDQNWREVCQDQNGETQFRFRYALRVHAPGYDNAAAVAWSRAIQTPVVAARGRLPGALLNRPFFEVDPARGLATCLKPADETGHGEAVARVWETRGQTGPLAIQVPELKRARVIDLLERPAGETIAADGVATLKTRGFGFTGVRLFFN